ncbi:SusC/RagA family TonB-linked outer membrane protein [Spirosoma sp. HMF4905]|uniref:SusC/RagA family TonB-linked outer membrane protein n=1 Tax=Spirosoma arboris TaxID=2682092 RepID=A0A7K1S3T4_9BACT|nr:TonB-dependent receptor [Spirosoma arboris]MVM28481.1 SusC/RagA family TonB-linked outer membrane protein [Spirosoma arboris]
MRNQLQIHGLLLKLVRPGLHLLLIVYCLMTTAWANGADQPVTGTVLDEKGSPLVGVNIQIKGTTRGTASDARGTYRIDVPNGNSVLVFSYIGYKKQEITVGNQSAINVSLEADAGSLEEVVVVGYGTQKRSSLTGAVSTVTPKEITALPVPNVASALQGRVPGVSVVNNGGPGSSPIVQIRGIGSISYGSGPLYVIDGVPTGDLNSFNTNDIESLEVLKDASSAAIYGSRAANGVILITTKKGGRDSKIRVTLDTYVGTQSASHKIDVLNRDQYVQYAKALTSNAGIALPSRLNNLNTPIYDGATQTFAQTETNWQNELFRNAPIAQHQLSLSGGNAVSRFFASGSYFKQDGIMRGTDFERGSLRLNSDHQIAKFLSVGQTLTGSYSNQRGETTGDRSQLMHAIRMMPYWPTMDPTKVGGFSAPTAADGSDPENPLRAPAMDVTRTKFLKVFATVYADVRLTSFLKYRFNYGVDLGFSNSPTFNPIYNDGYVQRSSATVSQTNNTNIAQTITNQLSFDKSFGKHNLSVLAVAETQKVLSTGLSGSGTRPNNDLNVIQGVSNPAITSTRAETDLISYVGRVNYDYDGKYLLSASIRRDGSSLFAPGNKWGNFPSASVGWRINQESFMKGVRNLSELKLRVSYGKTGFNGIANYAWQSLVSADATAYPFGSANSLGSYFNSLGNTDLKWETTDMVNGGIDLGLFNNKVTFTAEVYNRFTDGLILGVPIPNSIGYSNAPVANIGSMKNWGYEFQAGYNYAKGDFRGNVSANIGITRNRVLSLATPTASIYAGLNADYGGFDITKTEVGQPIQSFYGWQVDGIFKSIDEVYSAPAQNRAATRDADNPAKNTSAGDIRFKDLNGDGKIDANDRTYLGSYLPKFNYGANFSGTYKNFDFTLYLQGTYGNKIYNGTKVVTQGMLRLFNAGTAVLNAWTPTNMNTDIPRAVSGDPNNNSRTSDRFIEDGSYMRVKNLTIGYSIPTKALGSLTSGVVNKVRVYVSSQNLLTLTKYTGYDPEIGSRNGTLLRSGIDYANYPQARTLLAGLQITF